MKKTLYLLQDGRLNRKDNSLFFESEKGRKFIPIENTNDICILGNVRVSKRFLDFSSQKKIPIHYIDINGSYLGSYYPREFYNSGHTIIDQVGTYLNEEKRIAVAKSIIEGFINQCIKVVNYYLKRRIKRNSLGLEDIKRCLENIARKVIGGNRLESISMLFVSANKTFLKSHNEIYNNNDFVDFNGQNFVNSSRHCYLERLGESISHSVILSEIYKTHLDPSIGFFHESNGRDFSLCKDILLLFKPIMVYRLIYALVNRTVIKRDDFLDYHGRQILNQKGKVKFVTEFDKRMRTTIKHSTLNRHVSYRRIIRLELYKIQKYIIEGKEYRPYLTMW